MYSTQIKIYNECYLEILITKIKTCYGPCADVAEVFLKSILLVQDYTLAPMNQTKQTAVGIAKPRSQKKQAN